MIYDNIDNSNLYDLIITKAPIINPKFQGKIEGITKYMVGLDRVNNTSDYEKTISNDTQNMLDKKAPLKDPIFIGIPEAPTAIKETNTKQIATTEFVKKSIENLAEIEEKLTNIHFNPYNTSTIVAGNLILKEYKSFKNYLNINNVDNVPDLQKPISDPTQEALNLKLDNSVYNTNMSDLKVDLSHLAPYLSPKLLGSPEAPTVNISIRTDQIATTKYVHNFAESLITKTSNIVYNPITNTTNIRGDVLIHNLIIGTSEDNNNSDTGEKKDTIYLTQKAIKTNNTYKLDLNLGNMFYIESDNVTTNTNINIINLPTDRICILNIKLCFKTLIDQLYNPYITKINVINKKSIYVIGSLNIFDDIIVSNINYNQVSELTIQTFIIIYDPILTQIFNIKSEVSSY